MNRKSLKAGVAELEITGRKGLELVGDISARTAEDVRSPLFAKALYLSDGLKEIVIITLDLFGLDADFTVRASEFLGKRCGLEPDSIMLVCSNTHNAPYTVPFLSQGSIQTEYLEDLLIKLGDAAEKAKACLEPASIGAGKACLPHVCYNRRFLTRNMKAVTDWNGVPENEVIGPEGPTDPDLSVLLIRDGSGNPMGLLWNFAAANRFAMENSYSADLPYSVQKEFDIRMGKHVPCFYITGCSGNIGFTFDLEKTTDLITSSIIAVQADICCDAAVDLNAGRKEMILPVRDYSRFWDRFEIDMKYPQALSIFQREIECMQKEQILGIPTSVQVVGIGNYAVAAFPGAAFVEFALDVKGRSPFKMTLAAGCANGYEGCIIPVEAFKYGGFEAWPARWAKIGPGGGEFMADEIAELLKKMRKNK